MPILVDGEPIKRVGKNKVAIGKKLYSSTGDIYQRVVRELDLEKLCSTGVECGGQIVQLIGGDRLFTVLIRSKRTGDIITSYTHHHIVKGLYLNNMRLNNKTIKLLNSIRNRVLKALEEKREAFNEIPVKPRLLRVRYPHLAVDCPKENKKVSVYKCLFCKYNARNINSPIKLVCLKCGGDIIFDKTKGEYVCKDCGEVTKGFAVKKRAIPLKIICLF